MNLVMFAIICIRVLTNEWLANYEKITDMIVPRSSAMIMQDNDYCLFNVTLFKKVVEEFKLHARERKFIVRDFIYNEEELAAGKNEITKLITDKKKQFVSILLQCEYTIKLYIKKIKEIKNIKKNTLFLRY